MAFCKFCGAQMPEDGMFCTNCGKQKGEPVAAAPNPAPTPVVTPQPTPQNVQPNMQQNYNQDSTYQGNMTQGVPLQGNPYPNQQVVVNMPYQAVPVQKNKSKLPLIVVGLLAIAAVIFFLTKNGTIGGGNYESPIKYMCEAMSEGSLSKLYKALPPAFEDYVSSALGLFGMDDQELMDELGMLATTGINIDYEIISKEPLTEDELEDYSDDLSSSFMQSMEVKTGYMLYVRLTMNGEEEYEYIPVGKIDGRWCIIEDIF